MHAVLIVSDGRIALLYLLQSIQEFQVLSEQAGMFVSLDLTDTLYILGAKESIYMIFVCHRSLDQHTVHFFMILWSPMLRYLVLLNGDSHILWEQLRLAGLGLLQPESREKSVTLVIG